MLPCWTLLYRWHYCMFINPSLGECNVTITESNDGQNFENKTQVVINQKYPLSYCRGLYRFHLLWTTKTNQNILV